MPCACSVIPVFIFACGHPRLCLLLEIDNELVTLRLVTLRVTMLLLLLATLLLLVVVPLVTHRQDESHNHTGIY